MLAPGAPAGAVATAGDGAVATTLRLSDVRALLGDRLKGQPTRANFRTGHLTICTMVPMRSVPHRDLWNAIDPNIVFGEDGTPWMSFGSDAEAA